jgi:uncharacterized protein (TIGR02300 family)
MAKPELGSKRVCISCSTRFYDLTKTPAVCPKCGTEQPLDQPRTRRIPATLPEDRRPKKVAPELDDGDAEVESTEEEAEDDDVIEDAADLDDDADAIGTDIEVEPDNDEREV